MDYVVAIYDEDLKEEIYYRVVNVEGGTYLNQSKMVDEFKGFDLDYAIISEEDMVCKIAAELAQNLSETELDNLSSYYTDMSEHGLQATYGNILAVFYEAVEDAKSALRVS